MPAVPPPPASNLSAGVAVARRDRVSDWLFLLLRVYRSWDFPKGMVERDEDPFAAAVREVACEPGREALALGEGERTHDGAPYERLWVVEQLEHPLTRGDRASEQDRQGGRTRAGVRARSAQGRR